MIKLINEDCKQSIHSYIADIKANGKQPIIVTDPPFNIGYKYNSYKDKMADDDYYSMLAKLFSECPAVVIHYPEQIITLSIAMNKTPNKICTWCYNTNSPKQSRAIAYYDVTPDFYQVLQPYKNPTDKRIKARMEKGITGTRSYDWIECQQVKNVSKEKTAHPCQMPKTVMQYVVGIIPNRSNIVILDPFCGSGTTMLACKYYGIDGIGFEIDPVYYNIAKERIDNYIERAEDGKG